MEIQEEYELLPISKFQKNVDELKKLNKDLVKEISQEPEAGGFKACRGAAGLGVMCCCTALCCICPDSKSGILRQIKQGSIGMLISFGKLVKKLPPGLYAFNPCTQRIIVVEMRAQMLDIGMQNLLTKDNATVMVDGYVHFAVIEPEKAIFKAKNYVRMISSFTQGTMKSIVAEHTLTEMLTNRKAIEKKLTGIIDEKTHPYGLKVFSIETMRVQLPDMMERAMAVVAERGKQAEANVIDARGSLESAKVFREAADVFGENEVSLQLHYFEVLKKLASEHNSMMVVPDNVLRETRRIQRERFEAAERKKKGLGFWH